MTKKRFKEHYESNSKFFLVIPAHGSPPYRMDGQPLTAADRAILAGKDPLSIRRRPEAHQRKRKA